MRQEGQKKQGHFGIEEIHNDTLPEDRPNRPVLQGRLRSRRCRRAPDPDTEHQQIKSARELYCRKGDWRCRKQGGNTDDAKRGVANYPGGKTGGGGNARPWSLGRTARDDLDFIGTGGYAEQDGGCNECQNLRRLRHANILQYGRNVL